MFTDKIVKLLESDEMRLNEKQVGQLKAFCEIVVRSNERLSLVSHRDCGRLEDIHIPDSLSLAPWVLRYSGTTGHLLDIGSGGGFPAIPIKVALPTIGVTLVERSVKKSDFLREVVTALKLPGVNVVTGEFPVASRGIAPNVITARAVENPKKVRRQILQYMPKSSVFLCQFGESLGEFPATFHVERIIDEWSRLGLRRGSCVAVYCK